MAKTTENKPKKPPKQPEAGPVLVEDPPIEEPLPEETASEVESEEDRAEADLSDPRRVPPFQRFEPEQAEKFWAFLGQLPDPPSYDLYGYRLFPVIKVMTPADWSSNQPPPTHIFKIKGLITQETRQIANYEWLRNTWGSGEYYLRLNDRRLKRTQNRQICCAKIAVNEWDTHLPIFNDWSELLPVERNKWVVQLLSKQKLIKHNPEGGFMAYESGAQPANTPGGDQAAMLSTVLGFAERTYNKLNQKDDKKGEDVGIKAMEIMATTVQSAIKENKESKAQDPIIPLMNTIVTAITGKKDDAALTLLTAQMAQDRKDSEAARAREFEEAKAARAREAEMAEKARAREMELLMKLLEKSNAPAPAPADPVAAFTAQAEAFKKVQDIFGPKDDGAKASHMNATQEFWQPIATKALEVIQPVFDVGAKVLGQMVTMKMAQEAVKQQGTQPRPAPPGQPNAIPQQQMMPAQQPQPQQPPPAQNAPQTPQESQQQFQQPTQEEIMQAQANAQMQLRLQLLGTAITQVDGTLRKYFRDGRTGGDFADWFCALSLPAPPPLNMVQEEISGVQALNAAKEICANPAYVEFCKGNPIIQFYREPQNAAVWGTMCPTPERAKEFDEFIAAFLAYDPEALEPEVIP